MRYDQITPDQRSLLLSPVAFHREHYQRLLSQLDAHEVPPDDRLRRAVEQAKEGVEALVFLLAERQAPAWH